MKLINMPSRQLVERLNRRGLGGYLRVVLPTPWANLEEALVQVDVDELSMEAVRAFLDLPEGGEKEVSTYNDAMLTEYFEEYSPMAKSFLITGRRSEAFKEYAAFSAQWMLLQSNPTAVTKIRGSLIIAGWENRDLDWAAITSSALVREATASRKNRATALAYWLGMFYNPPSGKGRPESRQRDPMKGKASEEERPKKKEQELWEIGPLGASPKPMPEPVVEKTRRRQLRRLASRGEEASTISIVWFPAQGPPRRMTVRIVLFEGAERALTKHETPPMAETMVEDQPTLMAEAPVDASAEEEALPESVLPTELEPAAGTMAAFTNIQIPTWDLGERILIAPQIWDADTPQVEVGAAADEVDIINLDN
jgi:hypothetical protein